MIPEDQQQLAALVRAQRAEVERLVEELSSAETPPSQVETRLMLEGTALRLLLVEEWLSHRRRKGWLGLRRLRYELGRIRQWTRPRLGRLRHYHPRPLAVPASYLSVELPDPVPTISIVTPCLEHGRFIERTLQSVLGQDYPALEYFVQDGGSTDETIGILERYEDKLAGWVSEPDDGQADAITRGFDRTSGEIMAWLNSDDLLLPGSLAYVARYFAAHPNVDVVYGDRVLIDDGGDQIGAWVLPPHDDLTLTLADFVPQETLFWRRRIWNAVGASMDASFRYALDWDLLLRFQNANAKIVHLPRFIGAFRIHEDQKTTFAHPLGQVEMARLRERTHGRPVSVGEINERLRPFYRRHVILHVRQRFADRLSRSWSLVEPPAAVQVTAAPSVELIRRPALTPGDPVDDVRRPAERD